MEHIPPYLCMISVKIGTNLFFPFSVWGYDLYRFTVCYGEQGMIMAVNKPYSFFLFHASHLILPKKGQPQPPFPKFKKLIFISYAFFCNKVSLLPCLHLHQEPAKAGTSLYHHPFLVLVLRYLVFLVFFYSGSLLPLQ